MRSLLRDMTAIVTAVAVTYAPVHAYADCPGGYCEPAFALSETIGGISQGSMGVSPTCSFSAFEGDSGAINIRNYPGFPTSPTVSFDTALDDAVKQVQNATVDLTELLPEGWEDACPDDRLAPELNAEAIQRGQDALRAAERRMSAIARSLSDQLDAADCGPELVDIEQALNRYYQEALQPYLAWHSVWYPGEDFDTLGSLYVHVRPSAAAELSGEWTGLLDPELMRQGTLRLNPTLEVMAEIGGLGSVPTEENYLKLLQLTTSWMMISNAVAYDRARGGPGEAPCVPAELEDRFGSLDGHRLGAYENWRRDEEAYRAQLSGLSDELSGAEPFATPERISQVRQALEDIGVYVPSWQYANDEDIAGELAIYEDALFGEVLTGPQSNFPAGYLDPLVPSSAAGFTALTPEGRQRRLAAYGAESRARILLEYLLAEHHNYGIFGEPVDGRFERFDALIDEMEPLINDYAEDVYRQLDGRDILTPPERDPAAELRAFAGGTTLAALEAANLEEEAEYADAGFPTQSEVEVAPYAAFILQYPQLAQDYTTVQSYVSVPEETEPYNPPSEDTCNPKNWLEQGWADIKAAPGNAWGAVSGAAGDWLGDRRDDLRGYTDPSTAAWGERYYQDFLGLLANSGQMAPGESTVRMQELVEDARDHAEIADGWMARYGIEPQRDIGAVETSLELEAIGNRIGMFSPENPTLTEIAPSPDQRAGYYDLYKYWSIESTPLVAQRIGGRHQNLGQRLNPFDKDPEYFHLIEEVYEDRHSLYRWDDDRLVIDRGAVARYVPEDQIDATVTRLQGVLNRYYSGYVRVPGGTSDERARVWTESSQQFLDALGDKSDAYQMLEDLPQNAAGFNQRFWERYAAPIDGITTEVYADTWDIERAATQRDATPDSVDASLDDYWDLLVGAQYGPHWRLSVFLGSLSETANAGHPLPDYQLESLIQQGTFLQDNWEKLVLSTVGQIREELDTLEEWAQNETSLSPEVRAHILGFVGDRRDDIANTATSALGNGREALSKTMRALEAVDPGSGDTREALRTELAEVGWPPARLQSEAGRLQRLVEQGQYSARLRDRLTEDMVDAGSRIPAGDGQPDLRAMHIEMQRTLAQELTRAALDESIEDICSSLQDMADQHDVEDMRRMLLSTAARTALLQQLTGFDAIDQLSQGQFDDWHSPWDNGLHDAVSVAIIAGLVIAVAASVMMPILAGPTAAAASGVGGTALTAYGAYTAAYPTILATLFALEAGTGVYNAQTVLRPRQDFARALRGSGAFESALLDAEGGNSQAFTSPSSVAQAELAYKMEWAMVAADTLFAAFEGRRALHAWNAFGAMRGGGAEALNQAQQLFDNLPPEARTTIFGSSGEFRTLSQAEIRDAKRAVARAFHPDAGGDAHVFGDAWQLLELLEGMGSSGTSAAAASAFNEVRLLSGGR